MKKKIVSHLLVISMIASIIVFAVPSVYATGNDYNVKAVGMIDNSVTWQERDTYTVSFQVQAKSGVTGPFLGGALSMVIAYDTSIFELVQYTPWDDEPLTLAELYDLDYIDVAGLPSNKSIGGFSVLNGCDLSNTPTGVRAFNEMLVGCTSNDGGIGYIGLQPYRSATAVNASYFASYYSVMDIRLGFKDGKSINDVDASSIRLITGTEAAALIGITNAVAVMDGTTMYKYRDVSGVDTLFDVVEDFEIGNVSRSGSSTSDYTVNVVGVVDDVNQFDGRDTYTVSFQVQTENGAVLKNNQQLAIAYDTDVFEWVAWDNSMSLSDLANYGPEYEPTVGGFTMYSTFGMSWVTNTGGTWGEYVGGGLSTDLSTGYIDFEVARTGGMPPTGATFPTLTTLQSVRLAFNPGKSIDDVTSDSIRLINYQEALDLTGIANIILINDGTNLWIYGNTIGSDTLDAPTVDFQVGEFSRSSASKSSSNVNDTGVKYDIVPVDEPNGVYKLVFSAKAAEQISVLNLVFSFDNTIISAAKSSNPNAGSAVAISDGTKSTAMFNVLATDEINSNSAFTGLNMPWIVDGDRTAYNYTVYSLNDAAYTIDWEGSGEGGNYIPMFEFYVRLVSGKTYLDIDGDTFKFESAADPDGFVRQFYPDDAVGQGIMLVGGFIDWNTYEKTDSYTYYWGSKDKVTYPNTFDEVLTPWGLVDDGR